MKLTCRAVHLNVPQGPPRQPPPRSTKDLNTVQTTLGSPFPPAPPRGMLPCPSVQDPQSLRLLPLTRPCGVSQTPELPAVSPPALGLPPPSPTGSLPTAAPESHFSATSPAAPKSQRSTPRPRPPLPTPQQCWARRAAPLLPNCLPSAGHPLPSTFSPLNTAGPQAQPQNLQPSPVALYTRHIDVC